MTNPYEILEKTTLILRKIFAAFHISCLCPILQGAMWPSSYRRCSFSGNISGSDLAVGLIFFFFCKFHPLYFQVMFVMAAMPRSGRHGGGTFLT